MGSALRGGRVSRRKFLQVLAAGGGAVAAGAAGPATFFRTRPAAAAGAPADTLIVGQEIEVQTFDPQIVYDNTVRITRGIYEPLVGLDGNTPKVVPKLATAWTATPDVKQWTVKLRSGV